MELKHPVSTHCNSLGHFKLGYLNLLLAKHHLHSLLRYQQIPQYPFVSRFQHILYHPKWTHKSNKQNLPSPLKLPPTPSQHMGPSGHHPAPSIPQITIHSALTGNPGWDTIPPEEIWQFFDDNVPGELHKNGPQTSSKAVSSQIFCFTLIGPDSRFSFQI